MPTRPAGLPLRLRQGIPSPQPFLPRLYWNDFETGTSGTNIVSGSGAGAGQPILFQDAFDTFGTNTAANPQFDNTHVHQGGVSAHIPAPNGLTTTIAFGWICHPSSNPWHQPVFSRFYFYTTSVPSSALQLLRMQDVQGGTLTAGVRLNSTGTLQAVKAGNVVIGTASAAIPLNQWIRIECRCAPSTATIGGEIEIRAWWTNPESPDPSLADYTSNNTNVNALGTDYVGLYRFGIGANPAAALTAAWDGWFDDCAANYYTWIGPTFATPLAAGQGQGLVVGQAMNRSAVM